MHVLRQSEHTVLQVIRGPELFLEFSAYYLRTAADLGAPTTVKWHSGRMVSFSFWLSIGVLSIRVCFLPAFLCLPGVSLGTLSVRSPARVVGITSYQPVFASIDYISASRGLLETVVRHRRGAVERVEISS